MAKDDINSQNGDATAEEGKKSGKLRLIIIIVSALLVLGGGGFAAYYFLFAPKPPSPEERARLAEEAKKPEILPVFALKPFVVNLADSKSRRYLKTTLKLELSSPELQEELEKRQPQVRDVILTLLSSKTADEVNSMEGKFLLREEVVKRINTFLVTGKVTKVFLEEFVVQ
ncbi:MAG: flagellar basal body-associated FliL family protein [Deltaproteobacteria bacterium]|nr:flagellar basal body-associated FliL family protein [Candidatus Anaeroferrophillacea bacterium]